MDAFEKLAKLAGASVESVGEGLPRTRAEAQALGVTRYFTGKPCLRGHVADRYAAYGQCLECDRYYKALPEQNERRLQYRSGQKQKDRARQRAAAPKRKEYEHQKVLRKTGDSILFAINQAWSYAIFGRTLRDIIPQCPEPQRSQLQALVDRIRADPQAGKAVVGLLRTMRELRKAELAEMRASAPDPV